MNAGDADPSGLSVVAHGDRLVLSGDLVVWALGRLPRAHEAVQIDLEGVTRMDTAGAWELAQRRAAGATLTGLSDHHTRLKCCALHGGLDKTCQHPAFPKWRVV